MIYRKKQEILDSNLGILLITHSRVIASKNAWLSRTIVPTDLSALPTESCELCRAILKRLQKPLQKKPG